MVLCHQLYFVAFTQNKFRSYRDVDNLSDVQFGEISHIIEALICGSKQLFFKIELTPVVGYKYGGIWFTRKETDPTHILVKSDNVSQPLITRKENDRIAVLNPKIRVPSLEASVLLKHQGAPQGLLLCTDLRDWNNVSLINFMNNRISELLLICLYMQIHHVLYLQQLWNMIYINLIGSLTQNRYKVLDVYFIPHSFTVLCTLKHTQN